MNKHFSRTPIEILQLQEKFYGPIYRAGISNVEDLVIWLRDNKITSIPRLGKVADKEIKESLRKWLGIQAESGELDR